MAFDESQSWDKTEIVKWVVTIKGDLRAANITQTDILNIYKRLVMERPVWNTLTTWSDERKIIHTGKLN